MNKNLPEYILTGLNFDKSRDKSGYEERVGKPDELSAVMGRITMNFQYLEERIDKIIIQNLLEIDEEIGTIITAELSYKNKVNLFASLYYKFYKIKEYNFYKGYENEHFKLLVSALYKCEELRNQILHSSISKNWKTNEIIRTKKTSKSKSGLKIDKQIVDIPYLFDVSDFMGQVEYILEECFLQ
tara:strand:+ start:50290 stop:50844 length:555 start_codon:yes stop_codon:yes gene_type:complete